MTKRFPFLYLNRNLSNVSKKSLAQAIQTALFDEEAKPWRIDYCFAKIEKQWFKATLNHKVCNGLDVMKLFHERKADIKGLLDSYSFPDKFCLKEDALWAEKTDFLDAIKYVGPPDINAKEIIRDFYEQYGGTFYIPVDMSHTFNEPCLLNYTFQPSLSFDDNWNEIRRIKKNENSFLAIDGEWKKYIDYQTTWVNFVKLGIPVVMAPRNYFQYTEGEIQGVTIGITQKVSVWAFDFYSKPNMKEFFINKYKLVPMSL